MGFLGGLGLTLGDYLRIQAQADQKFYESKEGPAKSVIYIFLPGGIGHQESFDPKPFAPVEYRGPLGSIATNIDGVRFSELWTQTAQVADKLAICRSMTHGEAAHERGTHNMFTGYRPARRFSTRASAAWCRTNSVRATTCRRTSVFRASRTSLRARDI